MQLTECPDITPPFPSVYQNIQWPSGAHDIFQQTLILAIASFLCSFPTPLFPFGTFSGFILSLKKRNVEGAFKVVWSRLL